MRRMFWGLVLLGIVLTPLRANAAGRRHYYNYQERYFYYWYEERTTYVPYPIPVYISPPQPFIVVEYVTVVPHWWSIRLTPAVVTVERQTVTGKKTHLIEVKKWLYDGAEFLDVQGCRWCVTEESEKDLPTPASGTMPLALYGVRRCSGGTEYFQVGNTIFGKKK